MGSEDDNCGGSERDNRGLEANSKSSALKTLSGLPFYPELVSERLQIRYWRASDIDAYASLCADEDVMRHLGGIVFDRLGSWRHMAMMIGHWQLLGYGHWVLEDKQSGEFIGRAGFLNPDGWPGFELGWTVAKEHWGKGYAKEAAREILTYVFSRDDQHEVISLIHRDNKASIAVALSIGETFDREAELKGEVCSVYRITRDEYLSRMV